jgi:hypothetical protein
VKETVREMAALTILSGKINPVQVNTIQMYPMIMFDGVKKATIHYDLSRPEPSEEKVKHNSLIVFDLETEQEQTKLEKRCAYLEIAVRELFWKEVLIEVLFNGKSVYKSES